MFDKTLPIALFNILLTIVCVPSARAQTVKYFPERQALGLTAEPAEIQLHKGYGDVVIDFRSIGQTIRQVNLGDFSRVVFNSDDPSCLTNFTERREGTCAGNYIYLKQIEPLDLPGLPTAPWTELKVITDENVYVFKLVYAEGQPDYTIVKLKPHLARHNTESWVDRYDYLVRGFQFALKRGYLEQPEFQQRVKQYLILVREGQTFESAARQVGISSAAVEQLIELGKNNHPSFQLEQ